MANGKKEGFKYVAAGRSGSMSFFVFGVVFGVAVAENYSRIVFVLCQPEVQQCQKAEAETVEDSFARSFDVAIRLVIVRPQFKEQGEGLDLVCSAIDAPDLGVAHPVLDILGN